MATPMYAEDAAILQFYHLHSLDDDVWEEKYDQGSRRDTMIQQFTQEDDDITSPRRQDMMLSGPLETDNDLQVQDDSDPLGIYPSIFIKEAPSNINITQLRENSSLVITNKSFQPRHFLLQVHKETSFEDLVKGRANLKDNVDMHVETLKNLVQTNFDRFVSAKNTIDYVYEEMKSKQLNEEQEYGTGPLQKTLANANERATLIYGPIVERRQKADMIRSTLNVLQHYKFFFNLPSSLLESVKQNKYETAIRDYKRGKYAYQHLKEEQGEDDSHDMTSPSQHENTRIANLHRTVFDKVWAEVMKIVEELQNVLFELLADPWRTMDEQEQTINFLYDLDTTRDPAWFYLDSQYKWITNLMKDTYQKDMEKINRLMPAHDQGSAIERYQGLQSAIDQLTRSTNTSVQDKDTMVWYAITDLVKSQSSLLLRCLPDFWRLSEALIKGKFSNKTSSQPGSSPSGGGGRRRHQALDLSNIERCRKMSRDIVELYVKHIFDFFSLQLSDEQIAWEDLSSVQLPQFVPGNANSIHVGQYLTRIISELVRSVNDINGIELAGEDIMARLKHLMKQASDMFIRIMCVCWQRDAVSFYLLEEWKLDPNDPHYTTLIKRYYDFHKFCARSAYKIASLMLSSQSQGRRELFDIYVGRIRTTFQMSTLGFLDGIVQLAYLDYTPRVAKPEALTLMPREKLDVRAEARGTKQHLRSFVIQRLINLFEAAYKVKLDVEKDTLMEETKHIDRILFDRYTERKSKVLGEIIRRGILASGIDWYNITKPREVHTYVQEALLNLVMIHSQVSSVARQLKNRVMQRLLKTMALECLESLRQVERFGTGGMLQATLEIEFMHQTLSQYVTEDASKTLQRIYHTIEQAYDQQQQNGSLQEELAHVKELLVYSRKSTILQFLCFKPNAERTSRKSSTSSK